MNTDSASKAKLSALAYRLANTLAWAVLLAAFAALFGHIVGLTLLADILSGATSKNAFTAIYFMATSGSVLLLNYQPKSNAYAIAGKALAGAVGGAGLLNLLCYQFGLPPALAVNVSVLFILVGIGIVLIDTSLEWVTQWLAPAVVVIALTALVGHIYGVQESSLSSHTINLFALDLATSLFFLALSTSYFIMRPERDGMNILFDSGAAGYMLRRLQIGAIVTAFLLGWLQIQSQAHGWYSPQVGITILAITVIVLFSFIAWMSALYVRRADMLRRQAEARVLRERRLFKVILDNLPVGVVLVKLPSDKVDLANPAAISILGFDPSKAPGRLGFKTIYKTNGAPYPYDELPLTESLRTGKVITKSDLVLHLASGAQLPIRVTAAPFNALDSKQQTGLLIIEDYSKGLEVEKMKDEFLSLATHQLQTPLTGIKSVLALLRDGVVGRLSPDQDQLVKDAYEGNERELGIVRDLLNAGRLESGRVVLDKKETNLTDMITSVIKEQKPTIDARKQAVHLNLPPKAIISVVDAARLRMCIENLVSNASKYTDESGAITIAAGQDASKTWIAVEDSGVGIAKKDIPNLFKRFVRIDNKLSAKVGGTGLGLYLVKQIIELHGGKILVESEPGKGTKLTITLPAKR